MFSCYSLQKPGAFVFMTASTFRLLAFLTFSTLAVAGVSPDTVDLGYATVSVSLAAELLQWTNALQSIEGIPTS